MLHRNESTNRKKHVPGKKLSNLYGGVIFITTFSLFYFFRNNQHPEKRVFLLRISSGNVNTSGVATCRCLQIY